MSTKIPEEQHTEQMDMDRDRDREENGGKMGWKHWGLMLLCCLPMIAIAILVIAGVWSIR